MEQQGRGAQSAAWQRSLAMRQRHKAEAEQLGTQLRRQGVDTRAFLAAMRELQRQQEAEWAERHSGDEERKARKAAAAERYRLRKYGLSLEELTAMEERQRRRCAICGAQFAAGRRSYAIDHCHRTGRIRGLLCHPCTSVLAFAREKREILAAASAYIEQGGVTVDNAAEDWG